MSALMLKIIACVAMLIDHIGYLWGILVFRAVGRIAFPIFLYFIYNGYRHTHSKGRYALRLGLFALISQVPFSLMIRNTWLTANGNVFFALLLALLCVWAADSLYRHPVGRCFCLLPSVAVFGLFALGVLQADNGARAIILATVFWLFDGKKLLVILGTFVAVFNGWFLSLGKWWLLWMLGREAVFPAPSQWQMMQIFALLALPLIFAYNGEKGPMPQNPKAAKAVQWAFYWFYPVHQVLLWLIRVL